MRAVILDKGHYVMSECAKPQPQPDQVLIKVAYAGVNRADLFQKQGKYPLPAGNPPIPGMEVSGIVEACGDKVKDFMPGDRVCALTSEGAYAENLAVPAATVLPLPDFLSLEDAAALPEALFTVWISLVWQGKLKAGETVLIHGGASGIGIIGIRVARILGARVFATAGSKEKCAACKQVGAERAINYREEDFVKVIQDITGGDGADVVLDMVGGDYFERNLQVMAHGGRMSIIAFLKTPKITANISFILLKHLSIEGSTLRSRPLAEKARIAEELRERIWPHAGKDALKPLIHATFPLNEAEKALQVMEQGLNIGKILIRM